VKSPRQRHEREREQDGELERATLERVTRGGIENPARSRARSLDAPREGEAMGGSVKSERGTHAVVHADRPQQAGPIGAADSSEDEPGEQK
jgi:hypothetical protein